MLKQYGLQYTVVKHTRQDQAARVSTAKRNMAQHGTLQHTTARGVCSNECIQAECLLAAYSCRTAELVHE